MTERFFEGPVLNSPYEQPARHWGLDADGQPTNRTVSGRRRCELITPVPAPTKARSKSQAGMVFDAGPKGVSTEEQEYNPVPYINEVRAAVATWRNLPSSSQWQVTPTTERLLKHWRHHQFQGPRPFFCQVEAVETCIYLAEVAPVQAKRRRQGSRHLNYLWAANERINPELLRIALKLATGSGKTMVMAMLIAWQTLNAIRYPTNGRFTNGFLVVTPGITIRDRLRVLQPNDPDSYYREREVVPNDLVGDMKKARIVITNFHALRRRERLSLRPVSRALLQGRGEGLSTTETEGEMLRRVMPSLLAVSNRNVVVLNDEAHHCYRERRDGYEDSDLKGDEKRQADKDNETARLWISGIETVARELGVNAVYDFSATPFFLRGSGYAEGTLFPWTVSDFSLMDAIESGIVKLPRVPVADNVPGAEMPKLRNLWEHIGKRLPQTSRSKAGRLDPLSLPTELQTAFEALYGHYAKTFELWQERGITVPPVFIVVCNNTATSKLLYDFIAGFHRPGEGGEPGPFHEGRLELFRNYDELGNPLPRPRTLLIDSEQIESGEALDKSFRTVAAEELEHFRRERVARSGDQRDRDDISDEDLLREVMNTVGKQGRLGDSVRCVVSVSMLSEGWDANTVTHILGVRAFGTQLLCEQVVGRALRRQSYELNENGLFDVEYADVLGVPFDFTAKPVVAPPKPPKETVRVHAVSPDRDALEIVFPRVVGYRDELPGDRLSARFTADSVLELTPERVGPSKTLNEGIVGEGVELTVEHLEGTRHQTIAYHLASHLLLTKFRDAGEDPKLYLFGQLKRISMAWLRECLRCVGGTHPRQLLYREVADLACERIAAAIARTQDGEPRTKAVLDAYQEVGSTAQVNFTTSKETRWRTDAKKCHLNWAVCDSSWEAEFCRVVEAHPKVRAYVKNHGLGFDVPYVMGGERRRYVPDFIVRVDVGDLEPLNLVVEIKGYRGEDAKHKADTMRSFWAPGVNNLGRLGRWEFAEFGEVNKIDSEFDRLIQALAHGEGRPREV